MYAFNLSTCEEIHFFKGVSPDYMVAYAWYDEHNRLNEFFAMNQDAENGSRPKWKNQLIFGKRTVAMGDWCAKTDTPIHK